MRAPRLAWQGLRRDWRAGELRLLALALLIAVAAISAVGFFSDRVRQALVLEAHQLLGADLLLSADHPLPEVLRAEAAARGLRIAETRTFPSMVSRPGAAQLAEIKAVSTGYPLRGGLRVAPAAGAGDAPASGVPEAGTVWIDERLAAALGAAVGDPLQVGRSTLRVDAILTLEPDRGVNFFAVAPRLLMRVEDLAATALVQAGSRVTWRLLLAAADRDGDPRAIAAYRSWAEPRLARGERLEDATSARPEMRVALERAQRFLGLSALATVVLAAVAVALAARRYMQRHLDSCAIMRCLGASQGLLLRLYLGQFALLGLAAALAGCLAGYAAHFVLHAWLAELIASPLPAPSLLPAAQGIAVGLLLLFGFAVPPLLQLRRVSTLRVLRRELGAPGGGLLGGFALGLLALTGLMLWIAGDPRLGATVIGGFLGALAGFALIARLAIRLAASLRGGVQAAGGFGWRQGLSNLERRPLSSVVQIVALSLGMMALLLLTATRGELLDAWRRAVPPDAPNRFVINIQPGQLAAVRAQFAAAGIEAEFAPMIRGRLTAINDQPVRADDHADDRARRLVEREFNLSWRASLPPGNQQRAGRWFAPGADGAREASVEEGLAKTLGLAVGDRLTFSVAGEAVTLAVVGLRKLDWDSMRVNFFVLAPPGVLEPFPASYITSFHLPVAKAGFVPALVAAHPNLTVVDVGAIVRQLQAVLDQVARAVQFVFAFTLLAGLVVLHAALVAAFDERRYELAVLRALGASRRQLRRVLLTEFAAVGGLSGLIAALGAGLVGQLVAQRALDLELAWNPWLPPLALIAGGLLVTAAGWLTLRRLLDVAPLEALRGGV